MGIPASLQRSDDRDQPVSPGVERRGAEGAEWRIDALGAPQEAGFAYRFPINRGRQRFSWRYERTDNNLADTRRRGYVVYIPSLNEGNTVGLPHCLYVGLA